MLAKGGDDGGTESEVGYEVAVHHVDVQPVGAQLDSMRLRLVGQVGKVAGEEGRGNDRSGRGGGSRG